MPPVDFDNGFIEIYRDARGGQQEARRASSIYHRQALAFTTAIKKLADNAAYFEEKAPGDPKYRRDSFKLPVVKAVETLIETGRFQREHDWRQPAGIENENRWKSTDRKNFLFMVRVLEATNGTSSAR